MSTLVFELNDTGLIVADDSGILIESPGFAIVEPKRTIVGEAAFRAARLNPRWTNNRFWDELSLEPVDKPTAQIKSHADLAYAQLDDIRKTLDVGDREIVIAVPGSFHTHQLALLLGIARECALKVSGLVDAAVAAAAQAEVGGDLLHIDILLHRVVLTRIRRDARLTRVGVDEVSKVGLAALRERWVDLIADAYVSNTRFDPLHLAETEQALYDRLPAWLGELETADSTLLDMQSGPKTHRVTLARESLLDRVRALYDAIVDQLRATLTVHPASVLLTHRVARLPGLAAAIARTAGAAPLELAPEATARGALGHIQHIRSEGEALSFVTALPAPQVSEGNIPDLHRNIRNIPDPPADSPLRSAGVARRPTHLLYRSRAYPIGAVPCEIGRGEAGLRVGGPLNGAPAICSIYARGPRIVLENHGAADAFLNDERVGDRAQLELGDRVRVGSASGDVLELIALVDRDGA